ncbi:MAG: helix-turn-helix domain-containing protein [Chloroflexi bacterium]|jgi:excisionase family DNA binding protein|nr:helix-turn-helix domain-containing protein [Chloroflexota bacterium]
MLETNSQFTNLMTGEEIAKILHVSRAYAYQLMRQKLIPTVKIGRSVRVRPEDLERFIAANMGQNSLLSGQGGQN